MKEVMHKTTHEDSQLVDINNRYLILTNSNSNQLIDSPLPDRYYQYDSDAEVEPVHKFIPKPSEYTVETIRKKFPILFEGKVHRNARSLEELNYLLVPDYLENWNILPPKVKEAFKDVMESNWEKAEGRKIANWNEIGIKMKASDHPLIDHLLFNIGCEVWDKVPRETDVIHSSLKGDLGNYNRKTSSRRYINPNAAAKEIKHSEGLWRPELLYREMNSISVLFETPDRLFDQTDTMVERRAKNRDLFHRNLLSLQGLKEVQSYVLSHEISLGSIRNKEFKPHSHGIVWFLQDEGLGFLEKAKGEGILKFRPEDFNTGWSGEKGMWEYIIKTQNLADVYRREWSEDGIREFNNNTKEVLRMFIEQYSGGMGNEANKKGKKMVYWSHIPSTTKVVNGKYHHRPLDAYKKAAQKAEQKALKKKR
jgi:hypothetical protein